MMELRADGAVRRLHCALMGLYVDGAARRWGCTLMGLCADGAVRRWGFAKWVEQKRAELRGPSRES